MAQPWLDVAGSAPSWFGSGSASSLQGTDLDAAYHGFMHAPEWYLSGRSDDAAKAAADEIQDIAREPDSQRSFSGRCAATAIGRVSTVQGRKTD